MSARHFDRAAVSQAAAMVLFSLCLASWAVEARRRPLDVDELQIIAAELESQAAEAAELSDKLAIGDVGAEFSQRHARQLHEHTTALAEDLASAKASPEYRAALAGLREIVVRLAATEDEALLQRKSSRSAAAATGSFTRLALQAERIDARLRRPPP